MRFPKLTNLFHRRVRSDPEIHRLASAPSTSPDTHPASAECIFNLALPPSSSSDIDVFTAYASPNNPTHFLSAPTLADSHHQLSTHSALAQSTESTSTTLSSRLRYRASDPVDRHHQSILAILTERIQDLETALQEECQVTECISELQAALHAERIARDAAEEANAALIEQLVALQDEVVQLRRVLFSAISSDRHDAAKVDPSTSASLSLDRLRHFFDLMVSVGAHRPVVDAAYREILQGQDAEAALVVAIKSAVAEPDSVWRQLLEPVTGPRTHSEYLAQVRCTLEARRQTGNWRKKAKFWKGKAREEGRHTDLVTPSISAISDVVEMLHRERQERVESMMIELKRGELSLHVEPRARPFDDVNAFASATCVPLSLLASSSSASTQSDIADIVAIVATSPSAPHDSLPATSSSMILPKLDSSSTARFSSLYSSNLPPLASETFRTSHSIKSVSSRSSRSRRGTGMTSSGSTSTTASVKSRRRHARVLALPRAAVAPSTSSKSAEPTVLVASPSGESEGLSYATLPAFSSLPRALVDFGRGSEEDLVLVLHTDFSDTSYQAEPQRWDSGVLVPSSDESGSTGTGANESTSNKKSSRLPVRMPGLRAIKRLSASIAGSGQRAPLVDATNANTGQEGMAELTPWKEVHGASARGRMRGLSVGQRERGMSTVGIVEAEALTSPPRYTKIPMGKRLQRFGLRGSVEGRR